MCKDARSAKLDAIGALLGALLMVAATWGMWAYYEREVDQALSHFKNLK